MNQQDLKALIAARVHTPSRVAEQAQARRRRSTIVGTDKRLMLIAADHPARGALRVGGDPMAMANRMELLGRLQVALERPGVDGLVGTPDIIEDLQLLGALDDKIAIGSMNRGGLAGTSFEIDDRFTAYDASSILDGNLDGGKMLTRIDPDDPFTPSVLQSTADAVSALADRGLMAMVEPFICHRVDGRVRNDLTTEAVIRSITVASALGHTSAYTWLKLPVVDDMERVAASTSLPVVLLGGEASADDPETINRWKSALKPPNVLGMVVGRALLYPTDDDVASAVDRTVELL